MNAAARLVHPYGDEAELLASAKITEAASSPRYARCEADDRAGDTGKFRFQIDWSP